MTRTIPFGQWVLEMRHKRGWSQADLLARASHLVSAQGAISRLEHTRVGVPAPDVLREWAEVFGVSVLVPLVAMGYLEDNDASGNWANEIRSVLDHAPVSPDEGMVLRLMTELIERLQAAEGR